MNSVIDQLLDACPIRPTKTIDLAMTIAYVLADQPQGVKITRSVASMAAHVGLGLSGFVNDGCLTPLGPELAKQALLKGAVDEDKVAELNTAVMMQMLGAKRILCVPRAPDKRTPDFVGGWGSDEIATFEVTRAKSKPQNEERYNWAVGLSRRLEKSETTRFRVHVSRLLSPQEVDRLAGVALRMRPGEVRERSGLWRVVADPQDFNADGFRIGGQIDDPPAWLGHACDLGTVVSAPCRMKIPGPSFEYGHPSSVSFPFDGDGYLEPLRRKLKRRQSVDGLPHIIVVDAGELPDFYPTFRTGIGRLLPKYPEVSAVMVFRHVFSLPKSIWNVMAVTNPAARLPIPKALSGKIPMDGSVATANFDFSKDREPQTTDIDPSAKNGRPDSIAV